MRKISFTICLLLFIACDKGTDETRPPSPKAPIQKIAEPTVIERAFASSTFLPHSEYELEHIFQDNEKYWSTMPGAGPEETLQFDFKDSTRIGKIVIHQAEGESLARIERISIFGDGRLLQTRSNLDAEITLNETVQSLYISIDSTQFINRYSPKGGRKVQTQEFAKNKRVGIRHIELIGAKGEKMRLVAPKRIGGKAVASSTLAPHSIYSVAKLFDGQSGSAWVEGRNGNGTGEQIMFYFDTPVRVTNFKVWNGYQRPDKDAEKYGNLETITFGTEKIYPQHINLKKQSGGQELEMMTSHMGTVFGLRVKKASQHKDMAISEIVFYDGYEPFVMETGLEEKQKRANLDKHKTDILGDLLDKRENRIEISKEGNHLDYSVIIRSDGTLSAKYDKWSGIKQYSSLVSRNLIQGDWVLLEENPTSVKLKVSGILKKCSSLDLTGLRPLETKVFEELLTIRKDYLVGEAVIKRFERRKK